MNDILKMSKGKLHKNIKFNIISYTNKKHFIIIKFENNIKPVAKKRT